MLRKLTVTAIALILLGPSTMLLGVAVLMNPAANGACTATASSLTVGSVPDSLKTTTGDGTTFTLNKTQLTRAATIITVGSKIAGVTRGRGADRSHGRPDRIHIADAREHQRLPAVRRLPERR
ncbi:MAG: hypothetical protein LKI30_01570 [Bifidobacterium crudilactis]|jgi:hypothetical protein|nr:hypothetical protein [Bifidobacterium crudilactis]